MELFPQEWFANYHVTCIIERPTVIKDEQLRTDLNNWPNILKLNLILDLFNFSKILSHRNSLQNIIEMRDQKERNDVECLIGIYLWVIVEMPWIPLRSITIMYRYAMYRLYGSVCSLYCTNIHVQILNILNAMDIDVSNMSKLDGIEKFLWGWD